jgi:alpha-N-arabinofuranosidase
MQGGHRSPLHGFSPHFYTDFRQHPMRVADFGPTDWYAVLLEGLRTEAVIEAHWNAMGRFDPEHRTRLVIDEWGVWYRTGEEIAPAYILSQPVTLRDALHTAITFDVFNRHADKIEMANVAQTVNCIHSLFLALEDRYTRTPPYHVFAMYQPHKGARHLPLRLRADDLRVPGSQGTASMPALSASASLRDDRVTVTLTNPSLDGPVATRVRAAGGRRPVEARATVLTHADMRGRNTFDAPDEVRPASLAVTVSGDAVVLTLPKHSVAAVEVRIV